MTAQTAATAATSNVKRGPGRPRKDGSPAQPSGKKTAARKTASVSNISDAPKRGPGRPRKERPAETAQVTANAEPKRARGRPEDPNSLMGRARALYDLLPAKKKQGKNARAYVVGQFIQLLGFQSNVAGVYYHKIIDKIAEQQQKEQAAVAA